MSNRLNVWTIRISTVFLSLCLLLFVIETRHWPVIGDAGLMHYIVFLMHHGMSPYRDIVDPNMPATLLIEDTVIRLFGWSSLAWRLFDLFLLACIGLSMVSIARPWGRFAGFFAGALFALIHARDGVMQLGQRDLTMTTLLVIAYAFFFATLRASPSGNVRLILAVLFGIFCGAGATIKPSVILLPVVLLLLLVFTIKHRTQPFLAPLLAAILGTLIPFALIAAWLWHQHTLAAFLDTLFHLIPYFVRLSTRSYGHLFTHSISGVLLPLFLVWLAILFFQRQPLTWERVALLIGFGFGLVSFYVQRKGYPYHRYPSEAFLLLLISIDFATVLQKNASLPRPATQRFALAGILIGALWVGGGSTLHALRQDWRNREFETMLTSDLNRLGGQNLNSRIQCLDMADGCIPTLLDMKLVQSSGFLYDCYMFAPIQAPERERYREAFWQAIQRNPPVVFVVSSNDCEVWPEKPGYNYRKLSRWSPLDDYIHSNYHLVADRIPLHMVETGSSPSRPLGYKIYLQNSYPAALLPR